MLIQKEMKFFKLFNQQGDNMLAAAKFFNELVTNRKFQRRYHRDNAQN